ncbi:MAG: glycoside hydrolase family 20 zincin-like fold domain-containing protein [Planctomycetota bacterium]|jgi:hypothetical protein
MIRNLRTISVTVIALVNVVFAGMDLKPVAVDPGQARHWLNYTIPLPKKVEISSKIRLPGEKVAVVSEGSSHMLVEQAINELRKALHGGERDAASGMFVITLQVGGNDAEPLKKLKNADQAGRIFAENGGTGLRIVGLQPRGLYYAAKTLKQLIAPTFFDGQVEIPMVEMIDWPDMEDRGLWGADSYDHVKWMSDRKLNIIEQISNIGVRPDKTTFAKPKDPQVPYVKQGPQYGIKPVPIILHLEQISGKGIFQTYPELKPKGNNVHEGAICYSQPVFVDVLADWLIKLGSIEGVEEVDVWMTENMQGKPGCQCQGCSNKNRFVMETETIVAAWNKARKRLPNLGLRILTSEATEDSNQDVFEVLPKEVKIWYYHSLFTYNFGETPILRPYLEKFARKGHWMGVCPNLAMVHFTQPFTGAHFIHYRMSEFIDKGMSGIIGYVTPRVHYVPFNVEAMAEWSWNLHGRSTSEFAHSWAVRRRLPNPELFAEWSETIGPVAWNVYGSDWPMGEQRNVPGKVAKKLKEGTLPELGFVLWDVYRSPWGDIKSVDQLNHNVTQAESAVELVSEIIADVGVYGLNTEKAVFGFFTETSIVLGYIKSLKALWELKHLVTTNGIAEQDRAKAQRYFKMYLDSLRKVVTVLPQWETTVHRQSDPSQFTKRPIAAINEAIKQMEEVAAELGITLSGQ